MRRARGSERRRDAERAGKVNACATGVSTLASVVLRSTRRFLLRLPGADGGRRVLPLWANTA